MKKSNLTAVIVGLHKDFNIEDLNNSIYSSALKSNIGVIL